MIDQMLQRSKPGVEQPLLTSPETSDIFGVFAVLQASVSAISTSSL
jgi:hypothetical protein